METSEQLVQLPLIPLMSSVEDFPVRIFPSLIKKHPDSMEKEADCSSKSQESLTHYDPNTSSWKTLTLSSEEESTEFLGPWPKSGMMRNGRLYQRVVSGFPNPEKGSGLLPTLPASEYRDCSKASILARLDKGGRVARRICSISPDLRSLEQVVFLNPCFAEWMTGLPIGWTELSPPEMPSSPKSQNG